MESGPQKVDAVNSEKGQSLGKVIQEGFLEEEEVIVLSNWGVNSLRSICYPYSPGISRMSAMLNNSAIL